MKNLRLFIAMLLLPLAGFAQTWMDVTSLISNPSYAGNSKTGWDWSANAGSTSTNYEVQEFWNGTFEMCQTLTDIPNGTYRVGVQAFYRNGNYSTTGYNSYRNGTEDITAYLYANDETVAIKSIYSDARSSYIAGDVAITQTVRIPNNMSCASQYFDMGLYQNYVEVEVTDGTLMLGVINDEYVASNWCIFDNWTLEYLETRQTYQLTCRYQDLDGNTIAPNEVKTYVKGTQITEGPEIPGYQFVKITTTIGTERPLPYTVTANATIVFRYEAVESDWQDVTGVVQNSSFDDGVSPWEVTMYCQNSGFQGATYTNGSISISNFVEAWISNYNNIGSGYIYQDIYGLPDGDYKLEADVIACKQNGSSSYGTYLYMSDLDNGNSYTTECATGNGAPEHFSVVGTCTGGLLRIGLYVGTSRNVNWIALDNVTLAYSGDGFESDATSITIAGDRETVVGRQVQLSASTNASFWYFQKAGRWTSSNPSVATVDDNGVVTAVGAGTTTIRAYAFGKESVSSSITFTVVKNEVTSLVVNEIMAANVDQFVDPSWNYGGWMEIFNPSSHAVDISRCILMNDKGESCRLSNYMPLIPASGLGVIWFDHADTRKDIGEGWINTNAAIKLDCDGGVITLCDPDGVVVVQQEYPAAVSRTSYARTVDNGAEWSYCSTPTPGASNNGSTFAMEQLPAPVVDTDGQLINGSITVQVTIPAGATLRYTTDGTTPTLTSGYRSLTGKFTVSDTRVYRFRLFQNGYLPSDVVTRSYIYDDKGYYLPVVSLVTDERNFYDDEIGIYVTGTNGKTANQDYTKRNFNMDWDRPVSFEYIANGTLAKENQDGYFAQEVDACISGGWSRKYEPRSLKLKASKTYGLNDMAYSFFGDKTYNKTKTLLLRNGGNDEYNQTRMKDAALQAIARASGFRLNLQSYQPTHVFLNGSYYGMLNLREPSNKHYGYSNYGIDGDFIDAFEMSVDSGYVQKDGTKEAFLRWKELSYNAANPATFAQIEELVDMEDYINYMAFKFYLNDWDWPHNNAKGFRDAEGKFHFVIFDLDNCVDRNYNNIFEDFEGKQVHNFYWRPEYGGTAITAEVELVTVFLNMLQNEDFKRRFIDTYCIVGGSVYGDNQEIEDIVYEIADNISTAIGWEGNTPYGSGRSQAGGIVSVLTNSYKERMIGVMRDYPTFNLTYKTPIPVNLTANISDAQIAVNGVEVPRHKFNGYLFAPVTLTAKAPAGYRFKGWKAEDGGSTQASYNDIDIFDRGAAWRYYDRGSLDGTNWKLSSYSDATWSNGNAGFGYNLRNGMVESTTLDYGGNASNKRPTYYFRKHFTLDNEPNAESYYTLNCDFDDGYIIYINGVEIARRRLDGNSYSEYAWAYGSDPWDSDNIDIPYSFLHKGDNVIAVELHNQSATSSDVYWDARMYATVYVEDEASDYLDTHETFCMTDYDQPSYTLVAEFEPIEDQTQRYEAGATPVRINEVSAGNDIYVNEYNKKYDWVELYNTTDHDIDLAGLYLSDNTKKPQKWQITPLDGASVIPAHGTRIVWCDELASVTQLHAPFKLDNADGATITLQAEDGTWADCMTYLYQPRWQTYGRYPDGANFTSLLSVPTIDNSNRYGYIDAVVNNFQDEESAITIELAQGWNWMSHNLASDVNISRFNYYADFICSQNKESIYDPLLGWQGNLKNVSVVKGYKVHMNETADITLRGKIYDTENSVSLVRGWNWIGVPLSNATTIDAALRNYRATNGDQIVGLDAFATYEGGAWRGSLTSLQPGQSYLMKVGMAQELKWNSLSATKVNGRRYAAAQRQDNAPWNLDIHAYPNVMTLTAQLCADDLDLEGGYHVGAFVGDECRGVAKLDDECMYMNIHGDGGEKVEFRLLDAEFNVYNAKEKLTMVAQTSTGTLSSPFQLHFSMSDVVDAIDQTVADRQNIKAVQYFNLAGQRINAPTAVCIQKTIFNDGSSEVKKVISTTSR